ncbi:type VI secretion system baseplate subunit TssK [Xenorhabdus sp. 42]|uniref:type VI secretion system baseplate subunit TssK n=1 Tax=Xenorhabdus szentirmaii TaxID=290112 RepID=UPI0019C031F5|nr:MULTISPECIES: type VI secretion system baseplate subunit TssK [unclassified Xenorhabdus]MBD2792649.1 type VI secretion system baseplate subunit TssK [Xenorhabdus sp. CUL]MBD2821323.1 type VI secretion system baseplate subunit TssK [Xenorhabdus sp. 42]MBD2826583.1 type VI secretion system baseplate subunit TssK [Xenorhabdus sp. 5]
MNRSEKVIWTEGMFLRPHHFQQAENYLEAYVRDWGIAQSPYHWGFLTLELDQELLNQGKIKLSSASGIFPDGTPFSFDAACTPTPLQLTERQSNTNVVLALPTFQRGKEDVIFSEKQDSLARFVSFEAEVNDFNAMSVGNAAVQFGKMRLRLMLESDLTPEWTALSIAHIVNKTSDNKLHLDPLFIPPVLNCRASSQIVSFITDIQGLLEQRRQQISQRLLQLGRYNDSEIMDFLLLSLLNRHSGQVNHIRNLSLLHPERLFSDWLQFATELATFSPNRMPEDRLPIYGHDNLTLCFTQLMFLLRHGLSIILEEHAIQLPLTEYSHGLNIATLPDANMIHMFSFILAIHADVANDALMNNFPAQMKISPVDRIRELVQLQLPGISLRAMPSVPRQIPWHSGYVYFELEKEGELWKQMEKSGGFALHLAGEFPGLKIEFWAVRNQEKSKGT